MKKLLLSLLLLLLLQSAKSQLAKGNWLVGGSANFNSSNSTYIIPAYTQKSDVLNLSVSPLLGYFLANRLAAGLIPSFTWEKVKGGDAIAPNGTVVGSGGSSDIKRFLVGPFARYYLLDMDKPFNVLLEASYQYGVYSFNPSTGNINTFSAATGPVIFFNSSVGLAFTFGYASRVEDVKDGYKSTQSGLQLGIGFQIHLEK